MRMKRTRNRSLLLFALVWITAGSGYAQDWPPDISGAWYDSRGAACEIRQEGETFEVIPEGRNIAIHGLFEGDILLLFREGQNREPVKGHITRKGPNNRAARIEWSDGLVLTREIPGHTEPPRTDPDRPDEMRRDMPPQDRRRFDISGRWFINGLEEVHIEQHEDEFERFVPETETTIRGVIDGDRLVLYTAPRQELQGFIEQADPGGWVMRIEWQDGSFYVRDPSPDRDRFRDDERRREQFRQQEPRDRDLRPPGGFEDFGRMQEAIENLGPYRFRVEHHPGTFFDGLIDPAENRQYFRIGRTEDGEPIGEVYSDGDRSVGRRIGSDIWLDIKAYPLPNDIREALDLLRTGEIITVEERADHRLFEFRPPPGTVLDDPEAFFRQFLEDCGCSDERRFMSKITQLTEGMMTRAFVTVLNEDAFISRLRLVQSFGDGSSAAMTVRFEQTGEHVPHIPPDIETEGPVIPVHMLLFELEIIGGWYDSKTHGPWAQRSVDLIDSTDTSGQYAELYHASWSTQKYTEAIARNKIDPDPKLHHPIVLGAYYEDHTGKMPLFFDTWFKSDAHYKKNKGYYWDPKGYYRDYHHYGHKGTGLGDHWYFFFRHLDSGDPGQPATTKPGDRYYHCRDWGYGYGRINENLNRLTWTEAIKQYNSYTWEGKRRAYLMLGFVTHLLQDQAQPDHAWNVPHAGSGMNEKEAYDRYSYCEFVAGEAAAVATATCASTGIGIFISAFCGGGVYGAVYAGCLASIDPSEMGYEKLIGEKWNVSNVHSKIKSTGIVKKANYNAYFDGLSTKARDLPGKFGVSCPLGCGLLALIPPVPGADPNIQSNNATKTKPFYQMTNTIVPDIVCNSAGLMEHFYEIVNHPPFVERLAIVQWEDLSTPRKFAFFAKDKDHCLRYDAEWQMSGGKRVLKHHVTTQKLSLDRPAYIFLLFGPSDIAPIKGGRKMKDARLRLTGTEPSTGKSLDIKVQLTEAIDAKLGTYYWGSFYPCNCTNDPYTLNIEISGTDLAAHLKTRTPSGAALDGNPSTLAIADHTNYPNYPLKNYEWGLDTNHKIQISAFAWRLVVTPTALTFTLPARVREPQEEKIKKIYEEMKKSVVMEIKQKAWDCQWELFESLPCCTTKWELKNSIGKIVRGQSLSGNFRDFGISATLTSAVNGKATLTVSIPDPIVCETGQYQFAVDLTVGKGTAITKKTITIDVQVQ